MKKLKISLLLLLVFTMVIHVNYVYATESTEEAVVEDEAIVEDTAETTATSDEVVHEDVIDGSLSSFAPSTVTSVSTLDNCSCFLLLNVFAIIPLSPTVKLKETADKINKTIIETTNAIKVIPFLLFILSLKY